MRPSNIQQYEFLHGCVLTAIMRSDRPSTVRLIETDVNSAWSMYKVNDAFIHIKPRTTSTVQKRDSSRNWQFTFSRSELEKIKANESNVVLVCANSNIKTKDKMWRILIDFETFEELVDLDGLPAQDSISAKYRPNAKKIDISGGGITVLIAPKALLDWEIPGS
ncbi:hypothetical protein Pan258_29590 [Symmachiella dynata]|uniref:hypothetical protein n=1 Tax=Symmachiella dynata TaxID=2527995 RepID=UPI0011897BB8|nr:hypothetical protein [Symmachiella dynata]QDT48912.1 hypothetical protein Pan258_29590 [Symmachiella dynata]